MILFYGCSEDCYVEVLTGLGYVSIFNTVLKFFGSFSVLFIVFVYTYSQKFVSGFVRKYEEIIFEACCID